MIDENKLKNMRTVNITKLAFLPATREYDYRRGVLHGRLDLIDEIIKLSRSD